ncbi:MAG: translocation/assembly module TamB [Sphaerochaetaceae bacterium]|nr:translocation/assembly module TamB [Sphaerochaetaceae bacterium]
MKYHTTLSVILISLGALLFFLAVAVFCVDSLNLDSPGNILIESLENIRDDDLPFTLSFSAIDRKMDREITVHDIDFNYKGVQQVKARTATIVQNPASLFSKLLLRRGSIRILIEGLEFKYANYPEEDNSDKPSTFDEKVLLNQIADLIEKRTKGYLFNFDYEVIIDNANISYEDLILIDDCYAELKFDRGMLLRNIYFDIPSIVMKQGETVTKLDKLVAIADRTNSYDIDASFDSLSVISNDISLITGNMSFSSKFDTLYDLDIKHVPFDAKLESIAYADGKTEFNITDVTAKEEERGASLIASSFLLKHSEYTASTENIEALLSGNLSDEYQVSINSNIPIIIKQGDEDLIDVNGYDATLKYDGLYTLEAVLDDVDFVYVDDFTKSIIKNINLNDSHIYCQYIEDKLYGEINSELSIDSDKKYFDKTKTKFSAGFFSDKNKVTEYFLNVDGLYFPSVSSPIVGKLSYSNEKLSGNFRYSDSLFISLDRTKGFRLNADINSLDLLDFEPLISMVTPIFKNYIAKETALSGTIRINSENEILKSSTIYSSLALSNIRFNDYRFGFATLVDSSIEDSIIKIKSISASTEFFRASYTGQIDLKTKIPEGHFEIVNPNSGKEYFTTDVNLNVNNGYLFNASLPTIYESSVKGIVKRDNNNCLIANGTLVSGIDSYPVSVFNDPENGITKITSKGFNFNLEIIESIISSKLEFASYKVPVKSKEIKPLIINGKLLATFNFQDQSLYGNSTTIDLIDFRFLPSEPDIHFNVEFTNDYLAVNEISVVNDFSLLTGRFFFDFKKSAIAARLGNEEENAYLSILKKTKGYTGIIDVENFNLARFGFENLRANASLTGRGTKLDEFTFSGSMNAANENSDNYILKSDIILTPVKLALSNFDYDTDVLDVHSDSITLDSTTGSSAAIFNIKYNIKNKDRDYPLDINFNYSLKLPDYENFIDMGFNIGDYIKGGGFLDSQIHISDIVLDNGIGIWNRDISLKFNKEEFTASGNLVDGKYEIATKTMDVTIYENEIFSGHFKGSVVYPEYDILVEDMSFNLHTLVSFFKYPIFYFGPDSYVNANLRVYGKGRNFHIFGDVSSEKMMMNTWWIDQDDFVATNLKMTIIDNELDSGLMPTTIINRETGEIREGKVRFFGTFGGPNLVDHIALDAYTDENAKLHIFCPISSYNAQIEGYGWGHFTYESEVLLQHMTGEMYIEDFDIGIGIDPLPEWWEEGTIQYTDDFLLTFSKNVRFLLPNSSDPILTAYVKEGDQVRFQYDTRYKNATVTGEINLKGGEIYYFNKNFYITEGSLFFPSNALREPRISLRAKLSDYDSKGNRVDIYLVLNNSTINEFNPYFESSPQKTTSEIMSILGNVLVAPENEANSSILGSLVSIFSSGMDMMGRAGVISNKFSIRNLSDSIKENLKLDMFSVRTQLVQNVILDSVFTPGQTVYTPISRILNNTTVFFGKQLSDSLFIKGMIRLNSKEQTKNKNPFLSKDLMLDYELSLDWENPIGLFTFSTNPINLFPHNIMKNFGISYRKRIEF